MSKKITVFTENGQFEYEADSVDETDNFLRVVRKENSKEVSYTTGFLFKQTHTYTDYEYNTIAMFNRGLVVRVEITLLR